MIPEPLLGKSALISTICNQVRVLRLEMHIHTEPGSDICS